LEVTHNLFIETSYNTIHELRQERKEHLMRGIDLGSPIPANEIIMSFQKQQQQRRSSVRNSQTIKLAINAAVASTSLHNNSGTAAGASSPGINTTRSPKILSPTTNRGAPFHFKKPSESSLPPEWLADSDNPLTCAEYKDLTLHIFHSIN
jgi:hypothetical protein